MQILDFFNRQIKITTIRNVPIFIEYWWIPIGFLFSIISARNIPASIVDDVFASFALGILATILMIFSLLFHEFAHIRAAFSNRIETIDTIIFPFGGIARFRKSADRPETEFRLSIAGPIASILLSILFLIGVFAANAIDLAFFAPIFFQLFLINLLLGVLNFFPGYPLDGGRLLRLYLRKRGHETNAATILTAKYGKLIAIILLLFGLFLALIRTDYLSGFWLTIVGISLFFSASRIIGEVQEFEQLIVADVMTAPVFVEPNTTITNFMEKTHSRFSQSIFLVAREKQFFGVLIFDDIKNVSRDKWSETKIHTIMRPITPDYFCETNALVNDAREIMRGNGIGALGVIDEKGNLVGFLQRGKIRKRT
jgi:Zn-dependent protease/predicted transcriptional regulator